ncbi:MAG: GntR family transcriptional regulator [Lachnospiraceae bacterium]
MNTNINLKNKAYQIIKERIISCVYMPNTFLNENTLMEEIDASRTPIREALNKLEQEGFVQIIPKKGVMVTGLTLVEINHTFEARILLEPFILSNYMDRIDRAALQQMQTETEALIASEPDPAGFCRLDDLLHRQINLACPNKFFNDMLDHIYDQNQRIRLFSGRNIWERHVEAAKEHLELIRYILNGQREEAVAAVTLHLIKSKEAAIKSLIDKQLLVL